MKITVDIDCTPEEARAFLGLPDVAPMQAALLEQVQAQMEKSIRQMDPQTMMETWLPASIQGMETLQKAFWSAMAGAGTASGASGGKPADKSG